MRLPSFSKLPQKHSSSGRKITGHQLMMAILVLMLLTSATLLRVLWQGNQVHNDRLANAHQQYYAAKVLLENGAQENAAALWKLHWIATQPRYQDYADEARWPRLQMLYHELPFRLHDRLETIGGRTGDTIDNPLNRITNSILLSGLQGVVNELETSPPTHAPLLTLISILMVPAFFIWALLYHWLVHSRLKDQSNRVAGELQIKDYQLDTLKHNDPLTATSNRKAITQFLSSYQSKKQANNEADEFISFAILDLDYFQQINNVFGYFAGDAVLREVAERISSELRDEDQLGRLDADRYAIVLCELTSPKNAEDIIHKIQRAIAYPLHYQKNTLNITCTVGATVQRADEIEIADLFKLSDQALFQAKQNRRGSVFLLSDQQQEALSRQRQIINTLKHRPPEEIFSLAFQPIVDLQTRTVSGCECLLRWTADEPEHLSAAELVPILEMYGDINEVGLWVLKNSMQQLKDWQMRYQMKDFTMSVNISARQIESEDLATAITSLANEMNLQPENFALELTETVAIKHLEAGRQQLALLKNNGFKISLDDFGTGYSSLQYLKNIPASSVKIDQSFVRELTNDQRDMAVVKGAIDIASAIGLQVIAEGIHTHEQANCLQKLGCDKGQGFLFSKPLTAAEFEYQLGPREATDIDHFNSSPAA